MRVPERVVLEGEHVVLEPLGVERLDELSAVGLDEELWRWTPNRVGTRDEMAQYVAQALHEEAAGVSLPFATIDRASGRAVGSTRYMNIAVAHARLEIGSTWLGRASQRTAINTEAKSLMLRHAFEVLGAMRVELKTDALNERSRAAIARIGAKEEGTLRKHMVTWSGRLRDTVYFSVLDTEWPEVRARLEARIHRG